MGEIFSHPIPAVIVLLGLLVFVHEFGHFAVGRAMGIAVEVFSIGFGPQILSWTRKGTNFRLSWIPLGGYVKFAGSHPSEDMPVGVEGTAYRDASLLARGLTIAAGPVANFILAVVVFGILGYVGIPHPPPLIGEVIDGSRAEAAGLRPGDLVIEVGGKPIKIWRELEQKIAKSPETAIPLKVQRANGLEKSEVSLTVTPAEVVVPGESGKKIGRAGIALGQLPAVVTVRNPDSIAKKAGLNTGDAINSMKIVRRGETQVIGIKSFWEFRDAIGSLIKADSVDGGGSAPVEITLSVVASQPTPLPTEAEIQRGQRKPAEKILKTDPTANPAARDVVLPLASLETLFKQSAQPSKVQATSKELLEALGIEDAQLTLGDIPEKWNQFKPGDVIVRFAASDVKNIYQLREALITNTEPRASVTVVRDGQTKVLEVDLEPIEVQKLEGKVTHYGFPVGFWVQLSEPEPYLEQYGLLGAVGFGVSETSRQASEMVVNLAQLLSGQIPVKALGGPMLIAKVAGDSAKRGWQTFLGALALISINLGVLNLFPIPVLDGGQLVMLGWEAVRRRPLGDMAMENFQKIGFAMILALVVLATYNDLSRFWLSMLSSVVGIFK